MSAIRELNGSPANLSRAAEPPQITLKQLVSQVATGAFSFSPWKVQELLEGVKDHLREQEKLPTREEYQDLAKALFNKDAKGTTAACFTRVFKDEDLRIEIAKLAAQQDGVEVSEFIKNYGITSQEALVEIAKLAAQQNGWGVSFYIKHYGITSQKDLVEIAKLAAQQSGEGVSFYIQNYGITSQEALVEIAKLAAQQSGAGVSEFIQRYRITSQEALVEIAKLAAQQSGAGVSKYIQNYGIASQEALVEIAKLAAQQDGREVSYFIKNYGIASQEALVEIAKLAAQQNGAQVSRYIQRYGITSQEALVEIAKLAAQQNGRGVSLYIQNYGIASQEALVEIAKIAAQQSGEGVSEFIQNYGITSQEALVEIAKLAAQQDGERVSQLIQNYGITSLPALIDIFLLCVQQNKGLVSTVCFFDVKVREEHQGHPFFRLAKAINMFLQGSNMDEISPDISALLCEQKLGALEFLFTRIKGETHPVHQKEMISWFLFSLGCLITSEVSPHDITPFLEKILAYRDPSLRFELSRLLPGVCDNPTFKELTDDSPHFLHLPCIYLAALAQNSGAEGAAKSYKKLAETANQRDLFKNRPNQRKLIHMLSAVLNESKLSAEDKLALLTLALSGSSEEILNRISAIQGIIQLGEGQSLSRESLAGNADFDQIFQQLFAAHIPITDVVDGFTEKYEKTFRSFRNPFALFTYAGKLNQLQGSDRETTLALLGRYAAAVLKEEFLAVRYAKDGNPHLSRVFQNPDVEAAWKKDAAFDLSSEKGKETEFPPVDISGFLRTRVVTDRHLGNLEAAYPFLYRYFIGNESCETLLQELKQLKIKNKESKELSRVSEFQQCCIRLDRAANHEDANPLIGSILGYLRKLQGVDEVFRQDMEELQTILKPAPSKTSDTGAQCTLVDAAQDFLLMGEETGGCQSVDGDPELNKCLLGYLMDGKNRLIAVKDKSGKLLARAILRLLWDEQHQRPVLMLERVYTMHTNPAYTQAILEMAKRKAEEMNLPLVSQGGDAPYQGSAVSLGGPAPYEYSDAAGGVQLQGRYRISNATLAR
jgi:hypothetical protein